MSKDYSPRSHQAEAFFGTHPVFTVEEFGAFLTARGGRRADESGGVAATPSARQSLLRHHEGRGRIRRVRRGLYAAVPFGVADPAAAPVDSFLVASRLTDDAVLAYHTALSFHGVAHSVWEERVVLSAHRAARPLRFGGVAYRAVLPPSALPPGETLTLGVEVAERQGLTLRVTGPERTLVDALDRPALSGGWEEVWLSLSGLETYLDMELVARYTLALGEATLAAKVGYYLESGRERLVVPGRVLDALRARAPRRPHYAERGRRAGARLVPGWNLLVPAHLAAGDGAAGGVPSGDGSPAAEAAADDVEDIPV